ncbi:MAG: protein translocase subunit SecD [Fibrobacterota bacterium]|nr:protein translocase subunit SecD [Fibrobacterota bacterium]
MKRDTGFRTVLLIIVLALCGVSLFPSILVFTKSNDAHLPLEQREREIYKKEHPDVASKAINLGLDLAGGTHIIVEVMKEKLDKDAQLDVMDRSLEIIRNRVDQYGLSEPVITRSGENRIIADLAGMGAEDARRLIGATALLEFKLIPEGTEFKPVLDKIDAFLNRRSGQKPENRAKPANDTAAAVQDIFGRVVGDTAAVDSAAAKDTTGALASATDSLAKADTSETAAEFYKNRPFGALLVAMGRDLAVKAENVSKAKLILEDPDVQALIPTRYQILWGREIEELEDRTKIRRLYLLKRRPEMTGATISDALPQRLGTGLNAGDVEVSLTFKGLGPKEFARVTGANIGKQLAIVLDSVVYSAPVIQGRIPNGRASITGIGDMVEAKQLAVTLRAGSLPAPMKIAELRSVGPTLGEENIKKGLTATLITIILVFFFLLAYYRLSGFIAGIALMLNMIITLSILGAFHATLTLPGIAGLALTLGMAVDANVLIMERIRDELMAGRSVRSAIETGYARAFRAIFDSNVTVLGTAAILYYMGAGPIKGFGLTLFVGVSASMFTAILVSRLCYDIYIQKSDPKTLSIGKRFDFLRNIDLKVIPKARIYVGISIAAVVISIVSIIAHKGLNLGVDFTGGHVYQVQMETKPDVEAIRKELAEKGGLEPKVQTLGGTGTNEILIHVPKGEDSVLRASVLAAVKNGKIIREETVGPTVGADLKKSAIISIFLALVLMVMYIWFRFGKNGLGYGFGAVIALGHDAIVTVGVFSLMNWEISLGFVAAILTIVGYSVNDTIVIFDRVRELVEKGTAKESFAFKVTQGNNDSFGRTIIISLIVLVSVGVLVAFGGSSMRDMNLALLVGVIAGGYSTIAIACPFVVWWDRRRTRPAMATKK